MTLGSGHGNAEARRSTRRIKGSAGIIYTILRQHSEPANRWFAQRYNVNNAWNFNGNNGNLNNNNVNNGYQVQAVTNLSETVKYAYDNDRGRVLFQTGEYHAHDTA